MFPGYLYMGYVKKLFFGWIHLNTKHGQIATIFVHVVAKL